MTEQRFEKALSTAAEAYMINRLTDGSISTEQFVTSKSFEKRINKLIKSEHNLYYKFTLTRARRLLCAAIIIILLLASMLSVGAVREMIANFFVEHFSDHNTVSSNEDTGIYPTKLEKLYKLSYIPEGYSLVETDIIDIDASYIYASKTDYFVFSQNTRKGFTTNIDNEFSVQSIMKIDDQIIYVYDHGNQYYTFLWDNGEYIFSITGGKFNNNIFKKMYNSLIIK